MAVAKQQGVGRESLRRWVNHAEADAGERDGLTTGEQAEPDAADHPTPNPVTQHTRRHQPRRDHRHPRDARQVGLDAAATALDTHVDLTAAVLSRQLAIPEEKPLYQVG